MRYLRPLMFGLDVSRIVWELDQHPELWNRHRLRTELYRGPHADVSDVWVRFRPWADYDGSGTPEAIARFVGEPHESAWYPAIDVLPGLRRLIFDIVRWFEVERLGGILITRIPPGGHVDWHTDNGWHATSYEKLAVLLRGDEHQAFHFDDGEFRAPAGTLFTFNNQKPHSVSNDSKHERITVIICGSRDARRPRLVDEGEA